MERSITYDRLSSTYDKLSSTYDKLSYVDATTVRYHIGNSVYIVDNNKKLSSYGHYFIRCCGGKRFMFYYTDDSLSNTDSILLVIDISSDYIHNRPEYINVTTYIKFSDTEEILDQGHFNKMIKRYVNRHINSLTSTSFTFITNVMTYLAAHLSNEIVNRELLMSVM